MNVENTACAGGAVIDEVTEHHVAPIPRRAAPVVATGYGISDGNAGRRESRSAGPGPTARIVLVQRVRHRPREHLVRRRSMSFRKAGQMVLRKE